MNVRFAFLLLLIFITSLGSQSLQIGPNKRYLFTESGEPFFYLGDTAWELFHRLDREEATLYLENRAEKGFTVIQAVVLAQLGGLDVPNPYGATPLTNNDPAQPNEAYFEHVDFIVDTAEKLGLYIGMLPTWGSHWSSADPGRVIFTPENAHQFGEFLGKRYQDNPIIWILGGDSNPLNDADVEIIKAMAEGLRAGDGGEHLITFHPRGPGLSSDYFHSADWLDFNMVQSSHAAHDHDNGIFIDHDYQLEPAKPTIDGEPRYERIQTGFYFNGFNRIDFFDDYDSRQAAYWALLAGACGHTYGNNNIWQMWDVGRDPVIGANTPWHQAIDHPGAFQMGHLARLFQSRPFHKLQPRQDIIVDGTQTGGAKIRAAAARDGSFAFIYSPRGEKFSIDKSKLAADTIRESWFDPRYGTITPIHSAKTKGFQTYTPPTNGRGNDWLLILDDASKTYPVDIHSMRHSNH